MFLGKSTCVALFGPSGSGKSFTMRGADSSDGGLVSRSINDILNLAEVARQGNSGKRTIVYSVKMSVYQIYNEYCNDLLTSQYSKNLKIEKFRKETGLGSKIVDLTEKELKNKRDFDNCMREAVSYRKVLAQFLKVNDIKKKSHLVISVFLEKRERIIDAFGKVNERSLDKFAQIDFVELASSELGLQLANPYTNEDDVIYKNISKTFNSLCNNIVCASNNQKPKYDTKLTLALKNSLNANSKIVMINCVNPSEEPPLRSYKSMKVYYIN
jgi:hypothetical protein